MSVLQSVRITAYESLAEKRNAYHRMLIDLPSGTFWTWKDNPMGDGKKLEAGRAKALRVRIPLLPLISIDGVRGVAVTACLAVNQKVGVRLPSDTLAKN